MTKSQIKENDVFTFRWSEEEIKNRFEPYHCFDGTLVAKKQKDDTLLLVDTYWLSSDNKHFKIEEAMQKGKLEFLCNLDDMVDIKEYETVYYNDEDIIEMCMHKGYHTRWLIKKGTQRSQVKMLQSIKFKIEIEQQNIRSAENSLKWHYETLKKIEEGDTSVHL
jgi:hypothetical protein